MDRLKEFLEEERLKQEEVELQQPPSDEEIDMSLRSKERGKRNTEDKVFMDLLNVYS